MKLDELVKMLAGGLRDLTATVARLVLDVGWRVVWPMWLVIWAIGAMLGPTARAPRRARADDPYAPLTLRLLLYGVLFVATLIYYGGREDLANLVFYGFSSPLINAAADGSWQRTDDWKPGSSIGGDIVQGLVSQNPAQFLSSSAVVAFALLLLFEIAFQFGRRINAQADPGYERDVFLCSAAGLTAFGLYLIVLWGPFLDSVGPATASTSAIAWIYVAWDGYVALWTGGAPGAPRRIASIEARFHGAEWVILTAFFVIPASVCFAPLIAALWRCAGRARAAATVRADAAVRAFCRATSLLAPPVLVIASLFAGSLALVQLADVFDPGRNLTIEGINLFPDPDRGQNAEVLSFVLRNNFDHPLVLGPRGLRVTVRLPAREQCWDLAEYWVFVARKFVETPDGPPQSYEAPPEYFRQIASRRWLRCADLREPGVDFPFEIVAIEPAGGAFRPPVAAEAVAPRTYVVAPGTAVLVVAREAVRFTPDIVMHCGLERLVPTGAVAGVGPVNELQVRVVLAGGRQTVTSDFRTYAAGLLQPVDAGSGAQMPRCTPPPPDRGK